MDYPRTRFFLFFWVWILFFIVSTGILFVLESPLDNVLKWPVSPVLLDRKGDIINARLSSSEEWCLPIPFEEMGKWLPNILIEVEDKRFYQHHGIDTLALVRASFQNIVKGSIVSGASTITSQLIRLSNPRVRTFSTKIKEFLSAWKLEHQLGKKQILELYLNRAPFGGPIRGVEAASRLYFGKRAKELSLGESSLLIGLLKGPTAFRPDKNPKSALKRRQFIIQKIAQSNNFPYELTTLALSEDLPKFRSSMPQKVWHFSDLAFKAVFGSSFPILHQNTNNGDKQLFSAGIVQSSIDMNLQNLLEKSLNFQLLKASSTVTAAGIIVENKTASIVAYVGNARFNPKTGKQWVDCALALRSPGSTLKPFAYLKAMEKGLIIPETLIADTPLRMGGQAPRNFDRHYRGPVKIRSALADSLNVPAVRVKRMLGTVTTLNLLRQAGFSHLREDTFYGDSVILGAGEVTLLELARAYTTLASLGLDRPLSIFSPSQEKQTIRNELLLANIPSGLATSDQLRKKNLGKTLYTKEASFLISDILQDSGRLPFIVQMTQAREESPIAFKTGTSYGLRDAWTVAYFPEYTIAIWFGKPDGGSDNKLTGLGMAAPVALQIARTLSNNHSEKKNWYVPPYGVAKRPVCALSGAAPSPYCPNIISAWCIPDVWRTTPCQFHTIREGKVTILWPPEFEDFKKRRFTPKDLSRDITISSPMMNSVYMITPGIKTQALTLKAEGVVYPVHWYVESTYLGMQELQERPLSWLPQPGKHTISLLDAEGKATAITVEIIDLSMQQEQHTPLF